MAFRPRLLGQRFAALRSSNSPTPPPAQEGAAGLFPRGVLPDIILHTPTGDKLRVADEADHNAGICETPADPPPQDRAAHLAALAKLLEQPLPFLSSDIEDTKTPTGASTGDVAVNSGSSPKHIEPQAFASNAETHELAIQQLDLGSHTTHADPTAGLKSHVGVAEPSLDSNTDDVSTLDAHIFGSTAPNDSQEGIEIAVQVCNSPSTGKLDSDETLPADTTSPENAPWGSDAPCVSSVGETIDTSDATVITPDAPQDVQVVLSKPQEESSSTATDIGHSPQFDSEASGDACAVVEADTEANGRELSALRETIAVTFEDVHLDQVDALVPSIVVHERDGLDDVDVAMDVDAPAGDTVSHTVPLVSVGLEQAASLVAVVIDETPASDSAAVDAFAPVVVSVDTRSCLFRESPISPTGSEEVPPTQEGLPSDEDSVEDLLMPAHDDVPILPSVPEQPNILRSKDAPPSVEDGERQVAAVEDPELADSHLMNIAEVVMSIDTDPVPGHLASGSEPRQRSEPEGGIADNSAGSQPKIDEESEKTEMVYDVGATPALSCIHTKPPATAANNSTSIVIDSIERAPTNQLEEVVDDVENAMDPGSICPPEFKSSDNQTMEVVDAVPVHDEIPNEASDFVDGHIPSIQAIEKPPTPVTGNQDESASMSICQAPTPAASLVPGVDDTPAPIGPVADSDMACDVSADADSAFDLVDTVSMPTVLSTTPDHAAVDDMPPLITPGKIDTTVSSVVEDLDVISVDLHASSARLAVAQEDMSGATIAEDDRLAEGSISATDPGLTSASDACDHTAEMSCAATAELLVLPIPVLGPLCSDPGQRAELNNTTDPASLTIFSDELPAETETPRSCTPVLEALSSVDVPSALLAAPAKDDSPLSVSLPETSGEPNPAEDVGSSPILEPLAPSTVSEEIPHTLAASPTVIPSDDPTPAHVDVSLDSLDKAAESPPEALVDTTLTHDVLAGNSTLLTSSPSTTTECSIAHVDDQSHEVEAGVEASQPLASSIPPASSHSSSQKSNSTDERDDEGLVDMHAPYDDLPPSSSPPMSSQVRPSSPERIFSSPPPDDFTSPPSSPRFDEHDTEKDEDVSMDFVMHVEDNFMEDQNGAVSLGKHPRNEDTDDNEEDEERSPKRLHLTGSYSPQPPPQPKRPTADTFKQQFRKLAKPFRSPIVKVEDVLAGKAGIYASAHSLSTPSHRAGKSSQTESKVLAHDLDDITPATIEDEAKTNLHYTAKAAKKFRPPSAAPGIVQPAANSATSRTSLFAPSSASTGPTIQSLQARVQKLKQALKIKEEETRAGGENLEALVTKWRTVGRDVAWLVWDTVKDAAPGEVTSKPTSGGWDEGGFPSGKKMGPGGFGGDWGLQGGWGYAVEKKGGASDGFDKNWGWDDKDQMAMDEREDGEGVDVKEEEDEEAVPAHTLGTMLRHLGIDPETLGWDEDEGDFVGDA